MCLCGYDRFGELRLRDRFHPASRYVYRNSQNLLRSFHVRKDQKLLLLTQTSLAITLAPAHLKSDSNLRFVKHTCCSVAGTVLSVLKKPRVAACYRYHILSGTLKKVINRTCEREYDHVKKMLAALYTRASFCQETFC